MAILANRTRLLGACFLVLSCTGCARYSTAPGALVGGHPYSPEARYLVAMTDEVPNGERHPGRFFIGGRGGVNGGSGDPANDMPTWGLFGRYRIRGPWLIGLAYDTSEWDFEQPGNLIDVDPAGIVDAQIETDTITAWGEYEFPSLADDGWAANLRPFVGVGVGFASNGDEHLSGTTETGGAFEFDIDGGSEIVLGALGGLRYDITRNAVIELGFRYDFHITELEITDNVTGRNQDVEDYHTYGIYLGVQFRW